MAASSGGALVARAAEGVDRGLAAQPCQLAGTEHWFVGLGARDGQFSTLLVTNPDAQAAEVELRVSGPEGAVPAPGSSGIAIPPYATRAIPLEGLVSAGGTLAVQVRATAGRVRVVAQDRHRDGAQPAGTDWVVPTSAPRTSVVVPGVPGGAGPRDVVVVNPGERTTTVKVEALGADGPFALEGADAVDVPPASTVRIPVAASLAGDPAGLRITSELPVAAAVVATSEQSGLAVDTATAAAVEPITGTGVLPVAALTDTPGELQLSNAGTAPATATVVLRDRDGAEVARDEVEVPPGASVARAVTGDGVWAEVVTTAPSLHAAVVLTSERDRIAGVAWLPAVGSRVAAPVPPVRQQPGLGG